MCRFQGVTRRIHRAYGVLLCVEQFTTCLYRVTKHLLCRSSFIRSFVSGWARARSIHAAKSTKSAPICHGKSQKLDKRASHSHRDGSRLQIEVIWRTRRKTHVGSGDGIIYSPTPHIHDANKFYVSYFSHLIVFVDIFPSASIGSWF